jgi:hypothetical protein
MALLDSEHAHGPGPAVTRASPQADLLAAHERAVRLNARVRQLEKMLPEALGEQALIRHRTPGQLNQNFSCPEQPSQPRSSSGT